MKSAELIATVQRWLDSDEAELSLLIDQAPVRLQRRSGAAVCIVPLSVAWRGDDMGLEAALRLSAPSIGRFSGALALDAANKRLCLMRYTVIDGATALINMIEELTNQRDVWEAMLQQASHPVRRLNRPVTLGKHYGL
ncbi:type III secretion system chaperone [Pseudomonas fluorescens]|uniref:HrpG protein n=1 Tax=Pseudomonas fluorescens TaxID=294 RepID=A0A944HID1_PSEFL|nr:type III secretion system chaperone [Pseudomonas fluorescens]MBT2298552.1 HrpG protein [Pseudomonas fluorescens]MBT2310077.1 HrpG protein [Pseudomonas fluorescens]MBT2311101.1 HrpG protein [Pseudomonas fluorescens]MBT2319964.1 HrpG protein [Pseudomonas fluorescens]MBT2329008.1 HrpG protein [Pseudomonas fluorescens]